MTTTNKDKVWFTSDTHLGHVNILKHANRPFTSIEEMDEVLIANINNLLTPGDRLYHLGDFAWPRGKGWRDQLTAYRNRINCKDIHFISGNHDKKFLSHLRKLFTSVSSLKEIKVQDQYITMCHYAMRVWNKSHYKAWHLYGHSHGSLEDLPNRYCIDVGVDAHNYCPIHFDHIADIMKTKIFTKLHH